MQETLLLDGHMGKACGDEQNCSAFFEGTRKTKGEISLRQKINENQKCKRKCEILPQISCNEAVEKNLPLKNDRRPELSGQKLDTS